MTSLPVHGQHLRTNQPYPNVPTPCKHTCVALAPSDSEKWFPVQTMHPEQIPSSFLAILLVLRRWTSLTISLRFPKSGDRSMGGVTNPISIHPNK